MSKKIFFCGVVFFVGLFVFASGVLAEERGKGPKPGEETRMTRNITPGQGRMQACKAREVSIKNRMNHLTQLATEMQAKFDRHAQKVEDYYNNKVVPGGKTVDNYDELVASIDAQKTAVTDALGEAQTTADAFSCENGKPKEQVKQFREDMQTAKRALKAYRSAIKDLIVAIRSVNGAGDNANPTQNP